MITKIEPDSGEVLYNRYIQSPQLVCGPNARQSEDVRRSNGAGREDYLLAVDVKLLMTADYSQAYRPIALEDYSDDKAVRSDGQARSIARRVEVANCRTHAHTAGDVECQGAYARGVRSIMVGAVGEPGVSTCPIEGVLLGPPFVGPVPAAADGAIRTMVFIREILVGFQLSQVGEYLFVPPLCVPPLRPTVEVLRHSSKKLSVVDCAGAAGDLPARDIYQGLVRGSGAKIPCVFAFPELFPRPVGVLHRIGHPLRRWIVCSRLEKQDRPVRVFR